MYGGKMTYLRGKVYYMKFTKAGNLIHRSTGKTNKIEAAAVEMLEKAKGEEACIKVPLLSEAIDRAYQEVWKSNKSGQDAWRKAGYLLNYIEDKPVNLITDTDVLVLRDALVSKSTAATTNDYLNYLRTILRLAATRWRVIKEMPYIPFEKVRNGRLHWLTASEEAELLAEARLHSDAFADLLIVLIDTGMRVSEALGLSPEDIDYNARMIHIWDMQSKSGAARSVPMSRRVQEALERQNGFRLDLSQVEYLWRKVRARLLKDTDPQYVLHMLRHTFASRLVQKGYDLYKLKNLLGHHSITQTERYAHLAPKNAMDALSLIEQIQ